MTATMTRWRELAACREVDAELMFPVGEDGGTPLARRQEAQAKAVCRRCPVAQSCLEWALTTGQDWGVWGGRTSAERRAL